VPRNCPAKDALNGIVSFHATLCGSRKKRFDPDTALAHRFFVRLSRVIGSDSFQILFCYMTAEPAAGLARGTLLLERAGIADTGFCSILQVLISAP